MNLVIISPLFFNYLVVFDVKTPNWGIVCSLDIR